MIFRTSIILILAAAFCVSLTTAQQITVARIEQMPNHPLPYQMRNWKSVAKGYDALVFDQSLMGQYLPLNSIYQNTVNYPASSSFRLKTYVGSSALGGEAINSLPAMVGAELVGINKKNQNGTDWVSMCKEWFNTIPAEQLYLNSPRASTGSDWWYETMPNVFFFQLSSLHPEIPEFNTQSKIVADRWLLAVKAMKGSDTPWRVANMDHRAWKFSSMSANDNGVHQPEASGAIGWILYQAYRKSGDERYRIGAELSLEFLNSLFINPAYELQLPYGVQAAARMNAELGTSYDIPKMFNWCFDVGPLRSWGTIVGTWGGYDVSGLVGEIDGFQPSYAFLMNTFQQISALAPVARYDERFARSIGKWVLNASNAMRLFYPNALPSDHQDGKVWSQVYDTESVIGYEALKETVNSFSPFATGDALKNGWAATNFALYGSSHVGYAAAVIETTNVSGVLQLDLLKTDFGHAPAYATFLYYNPYDSSVTVTIDAGSGSHDLYDAAANASIKTNVSGKTEFSLPSNSARVIVIVPAGGTVTYSGRTMLINGVVTDYHSSASAGDPSPRIKSAAASADTVLRNNFAELFCTADARDADSLSIIWNTGHGTVYGTGSQVTWRAPDTIGLFPLTCSVSDLKNTPVIDTVWIRVVDGINHFPLFTSLKAKPRKIDLNTQTVISSVAVDADGDTVLFSWSAKNGILNGNGNFVTWYAPSNAGNYWIVCTLNDQKGGMTKDSIGIEVRNFSAQTKGNLLAFYPFNGNTSDQSGAGRNGSPVNLTAASDRNGTANSAYSFDGSTSSIRVANDAGLNSQNAFSANFWMTVKAFYEREQYPLSHGNYSNRLKVSISNKHVRWTIKTTAGIKDLDSETELILDSLYNVSVTYNGSDMEIFLNGELDAFATWSGTIAQTGLDLMIGQVLPNDNNYGFNGVLDDLRLFDYGLLVSEITSLSSRITSVKNDRSAMIPLNAKLEAYPNPFNPSTTIRFSIPRPGHVSVRIVDLLGREVANIADGNVAAGIFEQRWDGKNCASGMYFCVMQTFGQTVIRKLVLMR